jgi:RimJ/RimL family protein N-acetyltransferase
MPLFRTKRLELVPMTLEMVEAVILGKREDAERLVGARMPDRWPNRELVERAFTASLDAIRTAPYARLWGNRVVVAAGEAKGRRVVGSVVFHGQPGADGIAEIAYGIEESSQRRGYATEAVDACVSWALEQERVHAVQAATFPWHVPSLRVLAKVGMQQVGAREHETMGEMLVFERRADAIRRG